MTNRPSTPDAAPVLILHIGPDVRYMLREIFEFEGYVAHETDSGEVALHLLQAAEGGMIVYLEPLFLRMPGNEQLHDYVMNRDEQMSHVWVLLASLYHIEQAMDRLRADGYLELPWTLDKELTSVENAQRLLQAKRIPPTNH